MADGLNKRAKRIDCVPGVSAPLQLLTARNAAAYEEFLLRRRSYAELADIFGPLATTVPGAAKSVLPRMNADKANAPQAKFSTACDQRSSAFIRG
jgi:hypothetical protein